MRFRRLFDRLTAALGALLVVIGLAVSAVSSYDLADRLLFSWRTGLSWNWIRDPYWIVAAWFTGFSSTVAGAFLVWVGTGELRGTRGRN